MLPFFWPANLRWAVRVPQAGRQPAARVRRSGPSYREHGGSVAPRFSSARRSASSSFSSSRSTPAEKSGEFATRRCNSAARPTSLQASRTLLSASRTRRMGSLVPESEYPLGEKCLPPLANRRWWSSLRPSSSLSVRRVAGLPAATAVRLTSCDGRRRGSRRDGNR